MSRVVRHKAYRRRRHVPLLGPTPQEEALIEARARYCRSEMAYFDMMDPVLRDKIAFSPVAFRAIFLWDQVQGLVRRLGAPQAVVMQIMAEQFEQAETKAFAEVAENISRSTGYVLPHILAGATLMQTKRL